MADLFEDKAGQWDTNPIPAQISAGVLSALQQAVIFSAEQVVMDFGAGTGMLGAKVAPHVGRVLAVDISESMLAKLAEKPELAGKVEIFCQDIMEAPLGREVDLVVSAMAMHHVEDTARLLGALYAHLTPGGTIAIADLDAEDGSFHPPGVEGVYHAGFERAALGALIEAAGFEPARFVTACEVDKQGRRYPIFLVTATKPR